MSIKMENYKLVDMNNFEHVCNHLVEFIKSTWNMKDVKPIDDNEIQKKALENFNGPDTSSAGSYSCEIRLSKNLVEQSEEYGHDPIETLISSCIAYGMKIEQERQKRTYIFNKKVDMNKIKTRMLPAYAETYIQEDMREKFVEDMYDSFRIFTNFRGDEFYDFSHNFRKVAKWEDKFDEFLKHDKEKYKKISLLMDKVISEHKNENTNSKQD